jgi:hypothetical protein
MRAQSLVGWSAVGLVLSPHAANAACVIHNVRPTTTLPTLGLGQEFSFRASSDCERLRFSVPGTMLSKIPKGGPDTGPKDRTYKVFLTESEWGSVVGDDDTTFQWTIIGKTSAGVTTRVTTTNELGRGPMLELSLADAMLVGEELNDQAGASVSGAGDVDGDGHDDLLIGAFTQSEGGSDAGAAYLVRGPVTGTLDLSLADAKLVGEEPSDFAGYSVSGAGDVDGDGHSDLLVAAYCNDEGGSQAGAAYLVLGPVTGTLDLSLADAKLVGENEFDYAGSSVSGAWYGDGPGDLIVGAGGNDEGGSRAGAAYLVTGPVTGTRDLSLTDAKLVGEEPGDEAANVSSAGDVDGDGHNDVLVGAPYYADPDRGSAVGAAYLVLAPVTGTVDLSLADAKLIGQRSQDSAGKSVSDAGDVDGDGHHDLLIGAYWNDEGGTAAGAAYLVMGPVTGTRNLARADAKLVGEETGDMVGTSVSSAGDVDGDGHDDVLLGAMHNDAGPYAGAGYLMLGPVTGTLDLSDADLKLVGEHRFDSAGRSVSGAGDVDGDGRDDVMIGANIHQSAAGAVYRGAAYLLCGGGL